MTPQPKTDGRTRASAREERGWWSTARRMMSDLSQKKLLFIAAGAAFYGFLAVPATIAVIVSLCELLLDPSDLQRVAQAAAEIFPGDVVPRLLYDTHSKETLTVGLLVGLAIDFWTFLSGGSSIVTAFNLASGTIEQRSFIRRQCVVMALAGATVLFAVFSLALIALLPAVLDLMPLSWLTRTILSLGRWPLLAVVTMIVLLTMYRFAPSRTGPRRGWFSWGAVIVMLLWLGGSALLSIYLSQFKSYDESYGALGAVVFLLTWLYYSVFLALLGARIDTEIESRTRGHDISDSTQRR